ncbi:MAG: serine hydrolase, partial [Bacteroidota bacterium]
ISKTFIGIALLQAEREGLLSLDDPVNKHLPFRVIHPRYPNQPILLRHLTQHTAGINDDKNYDYAYSLLEPMTVSKDEISKGEYREMLEASQNKAYDLGAYLQRFFTPGGRFYHKKNFTKRAPGERYQYSNVGAALAAFALETASGQSFAEWTRERIFQPLGMNNTAWHPDEVDQKITHYFGNRKPMPNYLLATYPDGGVWTSVHQLGQYCTATIAGMQTGNDVLPREDYVRLLQNHVNTPKAGETYGNFWERISSDLYGHSGGDPGIVTLMYISEENGYGHVVFTSGTPSGENFYNKALIPLIRYGRKLAAL